MLSEWIFAFASALGNSLVDMCKKKVVSKGLNTWEVMVLINSYIAISNLGYCILTDSLPSKMDMSVFIICFLKVLGKILAQYTYLRSIKMAPLSLVIPYLAWNPVFLLITGAIFFNEAPVFQGIIGCMFVVLGAYLISMNAKNEKSKTSKDEIELTKHSLLTHRQKTLEDLDLNHRVLDENNLNNSEEETKMILKNSNSPTKLDLHEEKKEKSYLNILMTALNDFWQFKAGLFMMVTTLSWTYTSTIEKYLFTKTKISSPLLLAIQSTMITIIVLAYCLMKDYKFLKHLYISFIPLAGTCISESFGTLAYFFAIQGGLYVSYVTAVKRAGNILLSMIIGSIIYNEKLTRYNWMSAGSMIFGVCLIVLA